MSERTLRPAILTSRQHEPDEMESQDSEITAFNEINIEPFQKQYINGQSTPIDAVDALDTDDVDNLPYPTAFDEEEANHLPQPTVIKPSDYHIDDDDTIGKKSEKKDLKEECLDEKPNEAQDGGVDATLQGDQTEQPEATFSEIGAILRTVNEELSDQPSVKDAKSSETTPEAVSQTEAGDAGGHAEAAQSTVQPTNSGNQVVDHSDDTRDEFDNAELTTAQFGQQFALQVTDENYQESLTKQAFSQVYMPVSIQYNPETDQYQERSTGEQYVNQAGQMVQMPSAYYRSYGGQQVIAQRPYNQATTVASTGQRRQQSQQQQNDYNQENISPQQQQQYSQRLQGIGIPTPSPEVLAQYERQNQQQKQQQQQASQPQPPPPEMFLHHTQGEGGAVDMSIPSSCCIQYTTQPMAPQETVGRQPARIVNGKKIGVKPVNPKFDRTRKFPEKLYAVSCDPNIDFIRWSATGKAIIVNEKEFERRVMSDCPGLVQSDAFDNFRRQLREYQFECRYINMPFQYDYEFLHPDFQYEREDLLHRVKTRRRVMRLSQGGHEHSPPRKVVRRSGSFGSRRSSRAGCGNPSCHHHHPPQAPWQYNGGAGGGSYASGDAPLPNCGNMFPSCTHLAQWAPPVQPHTHGYNCAAHVTSPCTGVNSPDSSNSATPTASGEDNQQWQANQPQQLWYAAAASTPTPQALYASANWYHSQAPASSTQPVAVLQNPHVQEDSSPQVPGNADDNNDESAGVSPPGTEDGSRPPKEPEPVTGSEMAQQLLQEQGTVKSEKHDGKDKGEEEEREVPQVVELNEASRMSPITLQLRQVSSQDPRTFAGLQKLTGMPTLSSITSLGRLVQPLGTIYGQLETGAGDSMGTAGMQLQQPDTQPQQTQPSSMRQISA